LSLRDQGLIDLNAPKKSKILTLINMRDKNQGAALISEKTRKAEYDAFAAWIEASVKDEQLLKAPPLDKKEQAAPARPVEVIRHARKDRLLESFTKNIWSMRFRCMTCHIEGDKQCEKLRQEHGDRVAWMKRGGPQPTLDYLLSKTKLINTEDVTKSQLLTKPLMEVKHVGGKKFLMGDLGYKAFRAFLDDYANIMADKYATVADLPRDDKTAYFGSDVWLKITNTKPEWGEKLLMATVHAWDPQKKTWEEAPIAMTDRGVNGKLRLWQHSLTLAAPKGSARAKAWLAGPAALPAGRYLVKVFVDRTGKLEKDWQANLGPADLVGQAVLQSNWPAGYGQMTPLDAATLRKE
jgi:hypothetical protein